MCENSKVVLIQDMKDGDAGIIVGGPNSRYYGKIVQCIGDRIISLGKDRGGGWNSLSGNMNEVALFDEDDLKNLHEIANTRYGTRKTL